MEQDLFKFLPSEIINDILSRLPVRSIAASKCVCRSWLDLLQTDEFVNSHHSTSTELCLVVLTPVCRTSVPFTISSLSKIDHSKSSAVHCHTLLTISDFPYQDYIGIEGSANGLFFLYNINHNIVCNPISREYIHLGCPGSQYNREDAIFGFGASRISGRYKVVRRTYVHDQCYVYTLGTGSWRSVEAPHSWLSFKSIRSGACVNGNLHWLVSDEDDGVALRSALCFDLETECFSTFSLPARLDRMEGYVNGFSVLRDWLCVCCSEDSDEMAMWLMKEYGDEKSWTMEYVIDVKPIPYKVGDYYLNPIKVFKDDDMLMICSSDEHYDHALVHYSKQRKRVGIVHISSTRHGHKNLNRFILVTPSIQSLRSLGMENVISF